MWCTVARPRTTPFFLMRRTVRYRLPQQVFFCTTGTHCVFLDVDRDLYVAVHKISIDAIRPWLSTPYDRSNSTTPQEIPSAAASFAHDLVTRGLLTIDQSTGKSFEPAAVPTPRSMEVAQQPLMRNAMRFKRFYEACRAADQRLEREGVRDAIDFVRRRKAARLKAAPVRRTRLLSLVSTFKALRLFYPRPYLCLFDSLALMEFLATYSIFPTWVFGVHGEPFHAHCWVQHDDLLLDDSLYRIARLTPIMTV